MGIDRRAWHYTGVLLLLLSSPFFVVPVLSAAAQAQDAQPVVLYFFWGEGCPHCAQQKPFLEELSHRYPNLEVRAYELYHVADNRVIFLDMAASLGFEARYVPTAIIGERHWVGYSEMIAQEIEAQVKACSLSGCPDAGVGIVLEAAAPSPTASLAPSPTASLAPSPTASPTASRSASPTLAPTSTPVPAIEGPAEKPSDPVATPADVPADASTPVLNLPLIGAIELGAQSVVVSTAIIAFVDGVNPCSLWVLSILISLTLRTGSRKKVFLTGLVFLVVTSLIYGLFITGLFTMFTFIGFLGWIQVVVALLALFFAGVNIKDYSWYREGISLTIADDRKPGIYKDMRKVMQANSLWAMIATTVVMSAGVAIVELPCTAGFPVLWTNLLAAQGVRQVTFVLLLLLYMLIYLADELVVFIIAVLTLKSNKLEEKHGRVLKLIGGMLMLTLAAVMLIDPTLMNDVNSTLIIFAIAFGAAMLVLLVHRKVLPRFGARIGTEFTSAQGRNRRRTSKPRRSAGRE